MKDYRFDFFRTSFSRLPRARDAGNGRIDFPINHDPSLATLRQEVGGDRPRRTHGHGTGRARARIASAPAGEGGPIGRRRREGRHRAAIVGGRAGGPAVDLGGTLGGGHGAATSASLVDRQRESVGRVGGVVYEY